MRARAALALALPLAFAGCQEGEVRPQWIVWVGTDAPLPGFGDRIRVDVLEADGTLASSNTRLFEPRAGADLPLSFGVLPGPNGAGRYVRARLFRAENTTADGEPEDPLLDVLAELPPLAETPVSVSVLLGMDCFGRPASLDTLTSCNPASGETEAWRYAEGDEGSLPLPGSWGGGDRPCKEPTPAGMVCIPGGIFLMGSRSFVPFGPDFDPVPEQLVRLPPYFIDVAELDVGRARALVRAGVPTPGMATAAEPRCTYTADGSGDEMSLNCVDRDTAALLCEGLGKRLPTEAEWEFAAVDRSSDTSYPWPLGEEATTQAVCADAIVGRADIGDINGSRQCILDLGVQVGPVAGGSENDRSPLGVQNLGGNMSEWVSDDFAQYGDPICWGNDVVLREDPRCSADDSMGVARGGSWSSLPYNSHGFFRRPAASDVEWSFVGVRCAQDAEAQ